MAGTNFVNLIKTRGFFDLIKIIYKGQECFMFDYGPLGSRFRQNVQKHWWDLMVHQQQNVFPVESPALKSVNIMNHRQEETISQNSIFLRETLQQDCISKYLQILKLTNNKLPISVASVGACILSSAIHSDQPQERQFLFGGSNRTCLLLQNYTSPSNINTTLDFWVQLRLSWWKKFSNIPGNFSVTSKTLNDIHPPPGHATSGHNNQTYRAIAYQFPWGPEVVEEVKNVGDKVFRDLQNDELEKYMGQMFGKTACLPHCIECETSIEAATAAWLVDSYYERPTSKTADRKHNMVLKLHPQIAPFQVAIAINSASKAPSHEMHHVCSHLEREFKAAGVTCFNTSEHGSSPEAHFRRNDQLGIPYTVIVNENTMNEGLIHTRHRDTQIQSPSAITEIVGLLTQSLRTPLEDQNTN
ncbi:unnamed protein product [Lymnaea stagnalis]|uniref:Anticodon-binding domain-containing protein n=1 Tax=Lymnaea stagnalis TaxID=6523 RepID=A0AAV2H1H2_LYMST